MNKANRIFVFGAGGMVGSAFIRKLCALGHTNLIGSYHSRKPNGAAFSLNSTKEALPTGLTLAQVDLTSQADVTRLFEKETPEYVFLAAAKVGGIHANSTYPAQFIYENLAIQNNILHAAWQTGVNRLLFLGSSCIYPKLAPQPMKEAHLLTSPLEPTNEPYAIAKIAGIKMCEAYNRQYGTKFIALMPTNLYGPNDNFNLENSHVLPALIRKFHEAKQTGEKKVTIWGTGTPKREFLHVDDMANAGIFLMNTGDGTLSKEFLSYPKPCFANVGTGADCTIRELAQIIQQVTEFDGKIEFDTSKPDGTPRKLLNISRLTRLGWQSSISLTGGIQKTYEWYLNQDLNP